MCYTRKPVIITYLLSLLLIFSSFSPCFACDTWVAVASATKDGSVILAKNSDRPSVEPQPLKYFPQRRHADGAKVQCTHMEIPQVGTTYAHMGSNIWWLFGYEHGLNEFGVAIGNEAVWSKEPFQETGLLGMDLIRLALERAKTAYEAMHVITDLLEKYGQGGGAEYSEQWDDKAMYHNSFIIADPTEAWVLETAGKYWIAKRVEDVWAISNVYSLEADFDEAHPDLITHAVEMGWCKSAEDFNFARCYTNYSRSYATSQNRANGNMCKLREHKGEITVEFMMNEMNRSHLEGTINAPRWSPADAWFTSPCLHDNPDFTRYRTAASMVAHLRKDLPPMLRPVYWASFSVPCVNVFRPFYITADTVPNQFGVGTNKYSEDSPWWRSEKIKRLCDLNYNKLAPVTRGIFSETEKWELARSQAVEAKALALLKQGKDAEAGKVLQEFSANCVTRTEKEYAFLEKALEDMIVTFGVDHIWIDFVRENCKIGELSLPGL